MLHAEDWAFGNSQTSTFLASAGQGHLQLTPGPQDFLVVASAGQGPPAYYSHQAPGLPSS